MSDFSKSRLSRSDNWATPQGLYDALNAEFHFNDDPCPMLHDNSELFLGGLAREWGTSTFINPPYSSPGPFCEKAYQESLKGKTIVGLLRGDTSTKWFHRWVLNKAQEIRFIEGRVCFNGKPAPFPSIIVIWRKVKEE
jgi:site-specific DNA-methyltransferase (adenine-specific)